MSDRLPGFSLRQDLVAHEPSSPKTDAEAAAVIRAIQLRSITELLLHYTKTTFTYLYTLPERWDGSDQGLRLALLKRKWRHCSEERKTTHHAA